MHSCTLQRTVFESTMLHVLSICRCKISREPPCDLTLMFPCSLLHLHRESVEQRLTASSLQSTATVTHAMRDGRRLLGHVAVQNAQRHTPSLTASQQH